MSTLQTVIAVLIVLPALLVLASLFVNRKSVDPESFAERLSGVDHSLAAAYAQDRGWQRSTIDAAARAAFEAKYPDYEIESLTLDQVVDLPGTDSDQAVFTVLTTATRFRVTLGRRDGRWLSEGVERI